MPLKVTSWNVEHSARLIGDTLTAANADRRRRVRETIADMNPDILCMLEGPKGEADVVAFAEEVLGGAWQPLLLSARDDADGHHYAVGYRLDGSKAFATRVTERCHDVVPHPSLPLAVFVGRRPSRESYLIDTRDGRLLQTLVSERGEATGATLARRAVALYRGLDEAGRLRLFGILASRFSPDRDAVLAAAHAYHADPSAEHLRTLQRVTEPPRQEVFRRMNMAPGGTAALVQLRRELLAAIRHHPELAAVPGGYRDDQHRKLQADDPPASVLDPVENGRRLQVFFDGDPRRVGGLRHAVSPADGRARPARGRRDSRPARSG